MSELQIVEDAAREVFTTTAGAVVTEAHHPIVPDKQFNGFVATISLVGSRGGTLVVYCHRPIAVGMARTMLGMEDEEPDEDTVRDALGELVNQIGGTIKRKLGASGSEITLSVPLVVAGAPLSHCVKSSAEPISLELIIGEGRIAVCLWPA
ncbi:MAG: chemotaxis protein CheX [bacterium]|nr:chemotaxis protein CheX [bacterium]